MKYIKPMMKDLSQGSRISYTRQIRHITQEEVADHFHLEEESKIRTIQRYECNDRIPKDERLEELAKLYSVSINSIRQYGFNNTEDIIYIIMWLEEKFENYVVDLNNLIHADSESNIAMLKRFDKWMDSKELFKKRKTTVERSFGDSKQNHGYRYTLFKSVEKNQTYTHIICAAQNMKNISIKRASIDVKHYIFTKIIEIFTKLIKISKNHSKENLTFFQMWGLSTL